MSIPYFAKRLGALMLVLWPTIGLAQHQPGVYELQSRGGASAGWLVVIDADDPEPPDGFTAGEEHWFFQGEPFVEDFRVVPADTGGYPNPNRPGVLRASHETFGPLCEFPEIEVSEGDVVKEIMIRNSQGEPERAGALWIHRIGTERRLHMFAPGALGGFLGGSSGEILYQDTGESENPVDMTEWMVNYITDEIRLGESDNPYAPTCDPNEPYIEDPASVGRPQGVVVR